MRFFPGNDALLVASGKPDVRIRVRRKYGWKEMIRVKDAALID
jgi:hypothetical protein